MQRNAGPIYKIKKADADRVNQELIELKAANNALISSKQNQLDSLQLQLSGELSVLEKTRLGGMASRLEALSRLEKSSDAIYWASLFIMVLFIAVESAPVLVKLMSPEGPYDYLSRSGNYDYKVAHFEAMAKANTQIKKRKKRLTVEEQAYVEEKLDYSLNNT